MTGRFNNRQVVELTAEAGAVTAPPATAAAEGADLVGVPALVACRVKLVWEADAAAAAEVRAASQHPSHCADVSPTQHYPQYWWMW